MTCHALSCPHPALPGAQQCREHWLMLPAAIRAKRPTVDRLANLHRKQVDETRNLHRTATAMDGAARGQLELFA